MWGWGLLTWGRLGLPRWNARPRCQECHGHLARRQLRSPSKHGKGELIRNNHPRSPQGCVGLWQVTACAPHPDFWGTQRAFLGLHTMYQGQVKKKSNHNQPIPNPTKTNNQPFCKIFGFALWFHHTNTDEKPGVSHTST